MRTKLSFLKKITRRQYGGFDPNSPEANIIFSLYQNTYLDQSLRMASFVQQGSEDQRSAGRGVKQAGFLVLYKTIHAQHSDRDRIFIECYGRKIS